jgi:hypothetical protein
LTYTRRHASDAVRILERRPELVVIVAAGVVEALRYSPYAP